MNSQNTRLSFSLFALQALMHPTQAQQEGLIEPIDHAALFPVFNYIFSDNGEYGQYAWESHKLITGDGYEKILFRVTQNLDNPSFKPTKGTVLYVNGATSNVTSTFFGNASTVGKTKGAYQKEYEEKLKTLIEEGSTETSFLLLDIERELPDEWERLTAEWEIEGLDYGALMAETWVDDITDCITIWVDDQMFLYKNSLEKGITG